MCWCCLDKNQLVQGDTSEGWGGICVQVMVCMSGSGLQMRWRYFHKNLDKVSVWDGVAEVCGC